MSNIQYNLHKSEDIHGKLIDSLKEPRGYLENGFYESDESVVGTNNANGTLLLSKEVPAGSIGMVMEIFLATLVADATVVLVESDSAAVGGTETVVDTFNLDFSICPNERIRSEGGIPIYICDNRSGSSSKYLNLILPHARAGGTSNDAATQYLMASMKGVIES